MILNSENHYIPRRHRLLAETNKPILCKFNPKNIENISKSENRVLTVVAYKEYKCRGKYAIELIPVKSYKKDLVLLVTKIPKYITKPFLKLAKMLLQ